MPTIFQKIISDEIPSRKIFEDEHCVAFFTIRPNRLGHTLLVPRAPVGYRLDLTPAIHDHLFRVAYEKIWPAIQRATECFRVGLVVHGFGVPDHFHLHLIPMFQNTDLDTTAAQEFPESEMTAMQQKILAQLQK